MVFADFCGGNKTEQNPLWLLGIETFLYPPFLFVGSRLQPPWKGKWKSLSHVWLFVTPWTIQVHGILQARILEWVAFPFSRGSSQPRDWTQISHIAGGFFTSWATREAQEYWGGQPIPSPLDLPNPGIEPGSPAFQADSLPTELSGKP